MSELVAKVGVKREQGFLYFIDSKGDVSRSVMARGTDRVKGKEKIAVIGVKKEAGFLYFLDKKGNISRAKMKRGRK